MDNFAKYQKSLFFQNTRKGMNRAKVNKIKFLKFTKKKAALRAAFFGRGCGYSASPLHLSPTTAARSAAVVGEKTRTQRQNTWCEQIRFYSKRNLSRLSYSPTPLSFQRRAKRGVGRDLHVFTNSYCGSLLLSLTYRSLLFSLSFASAIPANSMATC